MTSLQYLLEMQRDWERTDTYRLNTGTAKDHGGGYGLGIIYTKSMFGGPEADEEKATLTADPARSRAS